MDQAETREHSLALGQRTLRRARIVRTSRERLARWMAAEVAVDVVMLAAAALSFDLVFSIDSSPGNRPTWHLLFSAIFVLLLASRGLYRQRLRLQVLDDLPTLAATSAAVAMAVISAHALLGSDTYTSFTVHYWLFATGWVALGRSGLHVVQARSRSRGDAVRPTLIAGAGKLGHVVARRLLERPELGLRPVGFLDKEPLDMGMDSVQLPVLGASWDLDRVVAQHDVQQVIITFSRAPHEVLLRLVKRCEELGLQVAFVPRLYEKITSKLTVEHLGGIPFISARPVNPKGAQFVVKYAVDRLVATFFLIMTLPLTLPAALGILLTLGRPLFFRQVRVGRDGRTFEMLKFRTMKPVTEPPVEADAMDLPPDTAPGGVEGDDRRTRLGMILRRSSIDELPQLLNVLKGDMSLIGPRPERPEIAAQLAKSIEDYNARSAVLPGITGHAQVHLPPDTSVADVRDKVRLDRHYLGQLSVWFDLVTLARTALKVTGLYRTR
jgi:exopolysaccharide biosynthesis polyprenyl glycosylphosphotransferase